MVHSRKEQQKQHVEATGADGVLEQGVDGRTVGGCENALEQQSQGAESGGALVSALLVCMLQPYVHHYGLQSSSNTTECNRLLHQPTPCTPNTGQHVPSSPMPENAACMRLLRACGCYVHVAAARIAASTCATG